MRTRLAALLFLLAVGCAGPPSEREQSLYRHHLVAFQSDGEALNPSSYLKGWWTGSQTMTQLDYQEQVHHIVEGCREYLEGQPRESRRVLIFVHGALNTFAGSQKRVRRLTKKMLADGYYPIFIAWDSNLKSAYFGDLLITNGEYDAVKLATWPYQILKDIVTGVLNIPSRVFRAFKQPGWRSVETRAAASLAAGYLSLADNVHGREQPHGGLEEVPDGREKLIIDFEMGEFDTEGLGDLLHYRARYPWWLASYATSFLVDAAGKRSWQGMLHRTKLLFDQEGVAGVERELDSRGLTLLFRELHGLQVSLQANEKDLFERNSAAKSLDALSTLIRRFLNVVDNPRYRAQVESLAKILGSIDRKGIISLLQALGKLEAAKATSGSPWETLSRTLLLQEQAKNALQILAALVLYPGDAGRFGGVTEALWDLWNDLRRDPAGLNRLIQELVSALESEPADQKELIRQLKELAHKLLFAVAEQLEKKRAGEPRVHIFAHSMGAIIVNEVLRRSGRFATPRFENIVYMAPACSVKSYEEAVFPYLYRHKTYGTQFSNLILHPEAERNENMFADVLPRGSLLVYVDDYLTSPQTVRDRTLGRFENAVLSLHRTRPEVADQISIRVFAAGSKAAKKGVPEGHGEFTPARFWDEDFWRRSNPGEP